VLIENRTASSLGVAALLGVSFTVWRFAGTADIYSVSLLLLVTAWLAVVREIRVKDASVIWRSGAVAGLAVLAHQMNVLIVPAVLAISWLTDRARFRPRATSFLMGLVFALMAGYAATGYLANGTLAPAVLLGWMRGYLGDPEFGHYLQPSSIGAGFAGALSALAAPGSGRLALVIRLWLVLVLAACLGVGWLGTRREDRVTRIFVVVLVASYLVDTAAIVWWMPPVDVIGNKYWTNALVPLVLAIALSWKGLERRLARGRGRRLFIDGLLPISALLLFAINLPSWLIQLHARDYTLATVVDTWAGQSTPDDVLVVPDQAVAQLRYWRGRPNAMFPAEAILGTRAMGSPRTGRSLADEAVCGGRTVLIPASVADYVSADDSGGGEVTRGQVQQFLARHTLRHAAFEYENSIDGRLTQVYRLAGDACG
jgi:hypothetical protein